MASSLSISPSSSASPPPPPLPLPPPQPSQSYSSSPSLSPKPLLQPAPKSKSISPPKKSPPLPWTHHETLALIQAYQEKWYSLKKGQLKVFQWEEVSVNVAARCGFDEPSKTATQCRHKIEKLRKRYRCDLQKPYPNSSWQYFEYMDQMERGPMPLNARPITVAKSFPTNASSSSNSYNNNINSNFKHGYGILYSNSADSRGDVGGSGDSDEKWNTRAIGKSKLKSVNNFVHGDVRSGVRSVTRGAPNGGLNGGGSSSSRGVAMLVNPISRKRKQYYADDSDDDDEEEEEDLEEEERVQVDEGEEGGGGMELAAEIRGFTERFMGFESKKIEMMRETQRYRMEMEKKRMQMILEAERKIVDTIGREFRGR